MTAAVILVAFFATFAALMLTVAHIVRTERLNAAPEPEPEATHCELERCNEDATDTFHLPTGREFRTCCRHAYLVQEWVGGETA